MRDKHLTILLVAALLLSALLYSCASMGTPSGGPRDEDPPRMVASNPAPDAVNFRGQRLEITFNELVNVKDAFTNVTLSPPDGSPRVSTSGRKVYVQFPDTLRASTTYTVDFGTAIEDNNEGNPLGSFSLTFSTGPELDSLRISGVALDAYTLEPQQGIIVGAHRADAPDSAFTTLKMEHITKTDDRGRFTLRGLKAIPYNLFALVDVNNDYRRDNPAELMGFYPVPVTPYSESAETTDTVYNPLTGAVDTVVNRAYTRFLPNNLLLSVFDEGYKSRYLVKYERPDSTMLRFIFNAPNDTFPKIDFVNMPDRGAYRLEYTSHLDTLTYWLADPRFVSADTLRVGLTYMMTGAGQRLESRTDTLTLTKPRVRAPKGKRNKQQLRADSIAAEKAKLLGVQIFPSNTLEVYNRPSIEFIEPVSHLDTTLIRLEMKQDTLWVEQPLPELVPDTTTAMRKWSLKLRPEFGATYRLTVDSLAATGLLGRINGMTQQTFTAKKREDYSSLTLRFIPDTVSGFVEVLNSSDNPVQRARVENGVVSFPWLAPADYYARFIADNDSDMRFTPGSYELRRQPEDVYYYPGVLSLKRYDRSEQWNLNATPVDAQKPKAILKNKPAADKRARRNSDEEPIEEEDEIFDVNANPFLPKSSGSTNRRR